MEFLVENFVLITIAFASGAMLLWPYIQGRGAGPSLDTLGATRLINDAHAVVLDIRETAEYQSGHLPNARHIPVGELEKRTGELPKNKPVLVCCASGARAGRAVSVLKGAGREEVFTLAGGIQAWRQAGLPVVK